jgi:hypothetical protein
MAITFLDLIGALFWPLILSAAVWAIAIYALAEKDQISKVVEALTETNGINENAGRKSAFSPKHDVSLPHNNSRATASSSGGWFQIQFRRPSHKASTY